MKNAVNFGAVAAYAEPQQEERWSQNVVAPQQEPEREPEGELIDARDRFTRKSENDEAQEASARMSKFFASQREKSRARSESYGSLRGLWV